MSKKFLKLTSLVMAIVMMMSMIGLQVSAADAEVLTNTITGSPFYSDTQGLVYTISNDSVYVHQMTPSYITATNVVIPSSVIINDVEYAVTAIGTGTFSDLTILESFIIPDSITSSLSALFDDCTNLTYVEIGDGATSIDSGCFSRCTSLETVIIGDGVTSIEDASFEDCSSLKYITLGTGLETIDYAVFEDCVSIETIYYTGTQEQWDLVEVKETSNEYFLAATVQCCAGHTVEDYLTFVSTTATADTAGVSTYLCECGHTVEVAADALGGDDSGFDLGSITDTFNTYIQAIIDFIQQIVEFFQGIGDMF